ncbi:hypothetical protein ABPG72_017854, partial [Tetrahymena utriculariae]
MLNMFNQESADQMYVEYPEVPSVNQNEFNSVQDNQIQENTYDKEISEKISASKSDQINQIKYFLQQNHLNYREYKDQIQKKLADLGYKLGGILNIGGSSIIISDQTDKNKIIKIFKNSKNNNEIVNNEKQIYELLNKEGGKKHFIKLIEHFPLLENWDAFIFQKYRSLKQLYTEYEKKKIFPELNLLTFVFDLINGLIDLRRASVIHLDIKTDNILIDEQGNLIYCDFGISELNKQNQRIRCRGYTEGYSPNEQIQDDSNNQIDFETDIYSLGKTLRDLVDLFIKNNPQSKLIKFAEELLKIVKDQMIQEDIKERSNCYKIYSQVSQLFEVIPQDFISQHKKRIKELKIEIQYYYDLCVDYYFEDIYQNLDQIKDEIKKSVNFKGYKNFENDQNKSKIIENLYDIKKQIQRERLQNLLNSILENLLKEIDEYQNKTIIGSIEQFDQFLNDYDDIENIANYLNELKKEYANDFLCLLKDPSIQLQDLQKLQNYLMELQMQSQQKSLNQKNALKLLENSINKIEQFQNEIKKVIIQTKLKEYSFVDFKGFLQCVDQKRSTEKDLNILTFCIEEYLKNNQIIKLSKIISHGIILKKPNFLSYPSIDKKELSFWKAFEKYQNFINNSNSIGENGTKSIGSAIQNYQNLTQLTLEF